MPRPLVVLSTLVLAAPVARAAPVQVSLGASAGVVYDNADAASSGRTRLGVGPMITVPVRIAPSDWLRIRLDLRLEGASGVDELTWDETTDGVTVRRTDDDGHLAIVGAAGLDAGVDLVVPVAGPVRPFMGGAVGILGVGAFHALRGDTAVLLDPEQNDLGDPSNLDPHTLQPALHAAVHGGVLARVAPAMDLSFELGYGAAYLPARALRKTPAELEARREAFAWNPLRVGVGFLVRLGRADASTDDIEGAP